MKAITLWQPWASLLACGAKQYETRSWATSYRGPIAIHAAKKYPHDIMIALPLDVQKTVYDCLYAVYGISSGALARMQRVCGRIIATADLVNCWRICYHPGADIDRAMGVKVGAESMTLDKHHPDFGKIIVPTEQELLFGDWTPVRYAWEFANMTMLPKPIPAKGAQRLWNWEPPKEVYAG